MKNLLKIINVTRINKKLSPSNINDLIALYLITSLDIMGKKLKSGNDKQKNILR